MQHKNVKYATTKAQILITSIKSQAWTLQDNADTDFRETQPSKKV